MAYPTLNQNKIFAALYNQIISIDTFADNIKGTYSELVDQARVDGGLYGDTKVYISTDCLKSAPWGNDAEATNLLALHRPPAPKTQTITLDTFRQICLTVDQYLSKQAFATEGAFSQFNSAIQAWIGDTKRIYDSTTYNTYIGNVASNTGKQTQSIGLSTIAANASSEEEKNRLEAQAIAQFLADLFVEMEDVSRDYNDNGFLRSVSEGDIKVIWNSKYLNKIKKIDLPTIFHNDSLVAKLTDDKLPSRYFGRPVNLTNDKGSGKVINASDEYDSSKGTLRVYEEMDITLDGNVTAAIPVQYTTSSGTFTALPGDTIPSGAVVHFFAGDEILNGLTVKSGGDFAVTDVYVEDADIICKICTKLPPYMSAFEVGTSFFNAKSLTENHYLTFGHNTLAYLKNYPLITVKA